MANKRMFTMKIVDSDAFLDMPLSAQCLYFHLNMRADDDGFIGNPKRVMKLIGSAEDDLKILIAKRFVLTFDDGVIVIKHWRMHNSLSRNRYHETQYTDEKSMLLLKENGAYSLTNGQIIDDTKYICQRNALELPENTEVARHRSVSGASTAHSDLGLDLDLESDKDIIPPKSPQGERAADTPKRKEQYYPENKALNDAFEEFIVMRNKIKKPLATKRAITRAKNKLENLSGGDDDLAIKILEQSIDHCWQDLYSLKPEQGGKKDGCTGRNDATTETDEYEELLIRAYRESLS